jgi:hypothetical protein
MIVTKNLTLPRLAAELRAAGITFDSLFLANDGTLSIRDALDNVIEDARMAAVVDGHVADLPIMTSSLRVEAQVATDDDTPTELYRAAIPITSIFDIALRVYGVDRASGAFKKFRREAAIRRLGAASAPTVQGTVETPAPDVGAATWTMAPSFDGNDLVITVTGAATRTIDWSLFAEVRRFSPGGIT